LADAFATLKAKNRITQCPLLDYLGAISIGKVCGEVRLDLAYDEDSQADVDMNLVMTGNGRIVEVQGTAEQTPFSKQDLDDFLALGWSGIQHLVQLQKDLVGSLN
jgi:ribonuclease PH